MKLLWVGLGGCTGAILRYVISGWVQRWSRSIDFPYGTLAVNMIGCLAIGFLSQLAESRSLFTPEARLFIFMGLLGAFTTFSTFSKETLALLQAGAYLLALANVTLQLAVGLAMVWLGQVLARLV